MQLWNDFSEHPIMFARQSSGPFSFSFAEVIFALLLDRVSCGFELTRSYLQWSLIPPP